MLLSNSVNGWCAASCKDWFSFDVSAGPTGQPLLTPLWLVNECFGSDCSILKLAYTCSHLVWDIVADQEMIWWRKICFSFNGSGGLTGQPLLTPSSAVLEV